MTLTAVAALSSLDGDDLAKMRNTSAQSINLHIFLSGHSKSRTVASLLALGCKLSTGAVV